MVTRQDIVSGMHVFRAVDIHTTNLKTGLKMVVPANLLYEVAPRGSGLAIRKMQAHWELNRMSRLLMGKGGLGMRTIAVMNWSMLRAFGPKWLMAYFKSSQKGVGRIGRDLVERIPGLRVADSGQVFAPGASIELPGQAAVSPAELLDGVSSLELRDLLASGRTVSGLASIGWAGRVREAGFVAELDADARQVRRLRWFWED
jgi:hypothetical protein